MKVVWGTAYAILVVALAISVSFDLSTWTPKPVSLADFYRVLAGVVIAFVGFLLTTCNSSQNTQ